MLNIRPAEERDKFAVWQIIKEVLAAGDTYTDTDSSKEAMDDHWRSTDKHKYVAIEDGEVVGTFYLRANQPGRGAHVGNASYMVSSAVRGQGVGKQMALWSLGEARRLGFTAMQFNFVVKTNEKAVALWQKIGFAIIGEIPDAFDHAENGLTNAYIMYRKL